MGEDRIFREFVGGGNGDVPATDFAVRRGAEESKGFEVSGCIRLETLRVDCEVLESFGVAFESVEGFVDGEVPDDYGGICAAGEEDGGLRDGRCEKTFDEVGVGGKGLDLVTGRRWVDRIDFLIPRAGVDRLVGANGEAGQGRGSFGEHGRDLASLDKILST